MSIEYLQPAAKDSAECELFGRDHGALAGRLSCVSYVRMHDLCISLHARARQMSNMLCLMKA